MKAAEQAYDLLFRTIYRVGKPYLFCCSKPVFCPTVHPGEKLAVGETVILLHPPSPFSRCFNSDGEGVPVK